MDALRLALFWPVRCAFGAVAESLWSSSTTTAGSSEVFLFPGPAAQGVLRRDVVSLSCFARLLRHVSVRPGTTPASTLTLCSGADVCATSSLRDACTQPRPVHGMSAKYASYHEPNRDTDRPCLILFSIPVKAQFGDTGPNWSM